MTKANIVQELLDSTRLHKACGWSWRIVPTWSERLAEPNEVPWLSLQDQGGAAQLKGNDQRAVWRVCIDTHHVVAKVFHRPRGWRMVKTILVGLPGRHEFLAALYGSGLGLPTVRPVAWGRRTAPPQRGAEVLLTEFVGDAQPLSDAWLALADSHGRRERDAELSFLAGLAGFIERLHRAKFAPADLHPENILVTAAGHFVLVDLHHARCGVSLRQELRVLNLADLNQWFRRHAGRTARLRFLLAYLNQAFEAPAPLLVRKYATGINDVTDWRARRLARKRDRRIDSDNKYFGIIQPAQDWTAHVFLQARRPIHGSRCSKLHLEKPDWTAALQSLLKSEIAPGPAELRLGDHVVTVQIEKATASADALRQRWQQAHRSINRHQSAELPLALLERAAVGQHGEAILVVERTASSWLPATRE